MIRQFNQLMDRLMLGVWALSGVLALLGAGVGLWGVFLVLTGVFAINVWRGWRGKPLATHDNLALGLVVAVVVYAILIVPGLLG